MPALNPEELERDGRHSTRAPSIVVEVGSGPNGPEDTPVTRYAAIRTMGPRSLRQILASACNLRLLRALAD